MAVPDSTIDSLLVEPFSVAPTADVVVPGSKSITNRALIAAALADGETKLLGALISDDTEAMSECLNELGIRVRVDPDENTMTVRGCGGEIPVSQAQISVRQSGTTARFIVPMLALGQGRYVVDAHPQMRGRPMAELAEALRSQGLGVESAEHDLLPFTIAADGHVAGKSMLVRGDLSSQFLSGLLLSAPYHVGGSELRVDGELISRPYVDMTCAVMSSFGVDVEVFETANGPVFLVPNSPYKNCTYNVEPDASAASYFFGLAAITGGTVSIRGLGTDSTQGDLRFVRDLEAMGCTVTMTHDSTTVVGPPVGSLRGGTFDMSEHSDTAPTIAAVAAFANEPVTVTGVGFIRHKESDRVGGPVRELQRCGARAEEHTDGFTVHPSADALHGATIETYDDHRMAMSFALIGARIPGVRIANPTCVGKTFPHFFDVLDGLR